MADDKTAELVAKTSEQCSQLSVDIAKIATKLDFLKWIVVASVGSGAGAIGSIWFAYIEVLDGIHKNEKAIASAELASEAEMKRYIAEFLEGDQEYKDWPSDHMGNPMDRLEFISDRVSEIGGRVRYMEGRFEIFEEFNHTLKSLKETIDSSAEGGNDASDAGSGFHRNAPSTGGDRNR
jgi:hypothetical protein